MKILFDNVSFLEKVAISSMNTNFREWMTKIAIIPSREQLLFFDAYKTGKNIILSACAGAGKSTCIKMLRRRPILVSATTGFAANLVGGVTIDYIMRYLSMVQSPRSDLIDFETIVVDEASMLGETKLLDLDLIFRKVFDSYRPFGGKQLILIGDFLQLPPVQDNCLLFSTYLLQMNFAFIYMCTIHRQSDKNFINVLNEVRFAKMSDASIEYLRNLQNNKFDDDIEPTIIVATNDEAKQINKERLEELSGEQKMYVRTELPEGMVTRLVKRLYLKIGAQVMLLYNLDVAAGLTNGSRGVVIDFSDEMPVVTFSNGKTIIIKRYEDVVKKITRSATSPETIDNILKRADKDVLRGYSVDETRTSQLPLKLAWAITIHKSQGTTISRVVIDCRKIYFPGQFYTAITRARDPFSIILKNFTERCIKTDSRIVLQLIDYVKGRRPQLFSKKNDAYEAKLRYLTTSLNQLSFT